MKKDKSFDTIKLSTCLHYFSFIFKSHNRKIYSSALIEIGKNWNGQGLIRLDLYIGLSSSNTIFLVAEVTCGRAMCHKAK